MITFSGWLFIVFALLSFTQLGVLNSGLERQFGLASTAMLLAMGIGLLLRRNWARWLALGMTLLTWTLGSLALLWGVVTLLKVSFGSARVPLSVYVGGMFVVVLLGAYIWLNVRLFERLTSDEGRKEFRTPFTERYAVVKSTAFHIAFSLIGVWVSGSVTSEEAFRAEIARATETALAEQAQRMSEVEVKVAKIPDPVGPRDDEELSMREYEARMAEEATARQAQREQALVQSRVANEARASARAEHDRKLNQLIQRLKSDRTYTSAQFDADSQKLWDELLRSERAAMTGPAAESSPRPATARQPGAVADVDTSRSSMPVLKCRDAAGAVSYTQGYCPAGTTRVQ